MTEVKHRGHAQSGRIAIEHVTLEMIVARLETLVAGQNAMNGALGLMVDTLHAQTNLLRKLSDYASETPAPSPIVKVLGELASAVTDMDASIGSLETKFVELSEILTGAFEIEIEKAPSPLSNGKAD